MRIRTEFVEKVRAYLEILGWSQAYLARLAGVSTAQVSGWLGKQDRAIGRDDVCRLAWAIGKGVEEDMPRTASPSGAWYGRGELDRLLADLLLTAGYNPDVTLPIQNDMVWERLESDRVLRVGWVYHEKLAYRNSPDAVGCAGLVTDWCEWLQDLMEIEFKLEQLNPTAALTNLWDRKVDLVMPVQGLPSLFRRGLFVRIPYQYDQLDRGGERLLRIPVGVAVHNQEVKLHKALEETIAILKDNQLL